MIAEERARVRHGSALTAVLPDGWRSSERRTFTSPAGTEIHVDVGAASGGVEPAQLLREQLDAVKTRLARVRDVSEFTVEMRESMVAPAARFGFDHDGGRWAAQIVCWHDRGLASVVSAAWPEGAGGDEDLAVVLDGARLSVPPTAAPFNDSIDVMNSPSVEPTRWEGLASTWATAEPTVVDHGRAVRCSAEELEVFTTIVGLDRAPPLVDSLLNGLAGEARQVAVGLVVRSLAARGVVATDDGTARLAGPDADLVEAALRPEVAILLERVGAGRFGSWTFALRPDLAVQVTVLPGGLREIGELEPSAVFSHVLALGGLGPRADSVPHENVGEVEMSIEQVTSGGGPMAELVRCTTAWRDEQIVHGEVHTWAIARDGALWLADADDTGSTLLTLRPSDVATVHAGIISGLPGSPVRRV